MEKLFPERPALLFDFVLPSRSKDFFLNLWIADPHGATSYVCCCRNPNGTGKINPCIRDRESSYGRGCLPPALHVSTVLSPGAAVASPPIVRTVRPQPMDPYDCNYGKGTTACTWFE